LIVGALIGAAIAVGYSAWHATSREGISGADRWGEFGAAMLFPGWLIVITIAVIVWMGWRANIDQS
jgi:hypothetical protein